MSFKLEEAKLTSLTEPELLLSNGGGLPPWAKRWIPVLGAGWLEANYVELKKGFASGWKYDDWKWSYERFKLIKMSFSLNEKNGLTELAESEMLSLYGGDIPSILTSFANDIGFAIGRTASFLRAMVKNAIKEPIRPSTFRWFTGVAFFRQLHFYYFTLFLIWFFMIETSHKPSHIKTMYQNVRVKLSRLGFVQLVLLITVLRVSIAYGISKLAALNHRNMNENALQMESFLEEIIIAIILAPVIETFVFQSIPIELSRKRLQNVIPGCIASVLIFSLNHVYNIYYFAGAVLAGIMYAFAYLIYENYWKAIFLVTSIHMLYNSIATLNNHYHFIWN
jgi:membrane protease YdiL (CAAX protease family)